MLCHSSWVARRRFVVIALCTTSFFWCPGCRGPSEDSTSGVQRDKRTEAHPKRSEQASEGSMCLVDWKTATKGFAEGQIRLTQIARGPEDRVPGAFTFKSERPWHLEFDCEIRDRELAKEAKLTVAVMPRSETESAVIRGVTPSPEPIKWARTFSAGQCTIVQFASTPVRAGKAASWTMIIVAD